MRYLIIFLLLAGCASSTAPTRSCIREIELPSHRDAGGRVICLEWADDA